MNKLTKIKKLEEEMKLPRLSLNRVAEISKELDELVEVEASKDETIGEVGEDKEDKEDNETSEGVCLEQAKNGLSIYRDYNKVSNNSKLKRLVR